MYSSARHGASRLQRPLLASSGFQSQDLTPYLHDNQPFKFDFHDFFSNIPAGVAQGFIFNNEDANHGILTKGLVVHSTIPGQEVEVTLSVKGFWFTPGAVGDPPDEVHQEIEIDGEFESTSLAAGSEAGVSYDQSLKPFLGELGPKGKTEEFTVPDRVPFLDFLPPGDMNLPPHTRIDYLDFLDVHAMLSADGQPGEMATSDFSGTTLELSTATPVPESGSLRLAVLSFSAAWWWVRRWSRRMPR